MYCEQNRMAALHSGITLHNLACWHSGNLATWHSGNLAYWHGGNLALWHTGIVAYLSLPQLNASRWVAVTVEEVVDVVLPTVPTL